MLPLILRYSLRSAREPLPPWSLLAVSQYKVNSHLCIQPIAALVGYTADNLSEPGLESEFLKAEGMGRSHFSINNPY